MRTVLEGRPTILMAYAISFPNLISKCIAVRERREERLAMQFATQFSIALALLAVYCESKLLGRSMKQG